MPPVPRSLAPVIFVSHPAIQLASLLALALPALPSLGAEIDRAAESIAGANGFRPLVTADRNPAPALAPASKEGEIRIKQFKVEPGFKVDLWAAEPMLANPVAFTVDERGRVFTSETYRYRSSVLDIRHYMFMLEDDLAARSLDDRLRQIRKWFGPDGERQLSRESEMVRLLEDADGDGRADKSTVFAENLSSPLDGIASGVLARHGEVWLTDIPSLWRFRPDNQPGIAGKPPSTPASASATASLPRVAEGYRAEELLRGFGVRFSFTGHDLHGLKIGPDGRLYFSCGDRGTHLVTKEGSTIDLPDEGAVFRCELDGSKLEVVHRGLRNPQELAFNEFGDLFTGDNDSDQGDRERWVQVIEGADSGWRVGHQHSPLGNAGMWNMERLWVPHFEGQAAYIVPPVANIGDGPSGVVHDYGTGLSEKLRGRFLLAYFKGTSAKSGICSLATRQNGAGYELVAHEEFIWNSLVPDVDIGPDGAVWFADWHEGWPKSNKGRIYRALEPGLASVPVVRETQRLLASDLTKRGEGELLALLTHPDMRVRQEAQFELAARGPKSMAGLRAVAFESKSRFARLHAIWGIGQIARLAPAQSLNAELFDLLSLAGDADPEIVGQTLLTLGDARCANVGPVVKALLPKLQPRQQFQAMTALSRIWRDGSNFRFWHRTTKEQAALRLGQAMANRISQASSRLGVELWETGVPQPDWPVLTLLESRPSVEPILLTAAVQAAASTAASDGTELIIRARYPSRSVRLAVLLTLRRLGEQGVGSLKGRGTKPATISAADFLSDPDPLVVLEAARAINDVPIRNDLGALAELADAARLDPLLKQFAGIRSTGAGTNGGPPGGAIRDVRADQPLPWGDAAVDQLTPMLLRVVNANFRVGTAESARRLGAIASRADLPELVRAEAVLALATWAKPAQRDRITGTFRPLPERDGAPAREALQPALSELLSRSPEAIRIAAAEAVARLGLAGAAPQLALVVKDSAAPALARAAALRAHARVAGDPSAVSVLLASAAKDPAEALRLEASKLNAELNPNDAAGQLAAKLTSGSTAEQQGAFDSLGDLKSDSADAILADWVDKLMKREVANEVMLNLVEAAAKRNVDAVKTRLAAYQDWKLPKDHLSPYREALSGGSAELGRKIFYERQDVACTRCHKVGTDGGGDVGPNLSGIATRGTSEYILESIVFPNQQIAPGFESVLVTLKGGAAHAGVLKSETADELVVNSPEDGLLTLKKAEITQRDRGLSGMPDGMGQLLTRRELRDLLEYLGTLR